MLKFLGRGAAFSDEHNSACFHIGRELVLIDCSMSAFCKLRKVDRSVCDSITILVTHTHSDHISGIPMLIDYEYFIRKIPVTIVAPSKDVREDLLFFLSRLDGCDGSWYTLVTADEFSAPWLAAAIPTSHTAQLEGRCFGYALDLEGKRIVYTGDTNTLEPFMPYLKDGGSLYTEASAYKTDVHICIYDIIDSIKAMAQRGISVFLMHMDAEKEILKAAEGTGASGAPLIRSGEEIFMADGTLDTMIFDISDKLYKEMCTKTGHDHGMLFTHLTELGKVLVGSDRASFWKWDKRKKELWTTSATGVDRIVIPDTTGLVGKALKLGDVVITNDPYNDPDFNSGVDKQTGYVTKSILVLPVADVNGEFIGAFQLINKNGGEGFGPEDVRKLSLAALICGLALESETFLDESHHDRLTGLKNRMAFYSDFAKKYSRFMMPGCDRPMSMFICDIDKFKRVNDTYGHNAGDVVLQFTAGLIESACTEKDAAYRWGGEEFIMIMQDATLEDAVAKAEDIRKKLEASVIEAEGNEIRCTLSFGCHTFTFDKTIEDNIAVADGRLYIAKESGRNRVISEG